MDSPTIYLDFAATAAVRPDVVANAVADYLRTTGATPGRSGHGRALDAGRVALRCRMALARLFSIPDDPGRIAFQFNATHALNTALYGTLGPGTALLRTNFDHNAVRRPAADLARRGVDERILTLDAEGRYDPGELTDLLDAAGTPPTVVTLPHASNVTGTVLPVREVAERAHEVGALVLLDAAQTAGHYPVDVEALGVDLLAFTGHKGLLGPHGIGGLWVREGVDVEPLLRGGTGGDSLPLDMPAAYPDHLEAGSQNGPAIAGLLAGIQWIEAQGPASLRKREVQLRHKLATDLSRVSGVKLLSPMDMEGVGIVAMTLQGWGVDELASVLDRRFGIQTRGGLHCAPGAHEALGTLRSGALRFSIGWSTTETELDRVVGAIRELSTEPRS